MIKGLGKLMVWIIRHIKERAEKETQPLLMKFVLGLFKLFISYLRSTIVPGDNGIKQE